MIQWGVDDNEKSRFSLFYSLWWPMETTLWLVFSYALLTAICTGLGALPFAFVRKLSKKRNGRANAVAAWLMLAASFGLIYEGLRQDIVYSIAGYDIQAWLWWIVLWLLTGLLFIVLADRFLDTHEVSRGELSSANAKKILLIVGVMTVHSFAEGVAIGVGFGPSVSFGIFIALALAIHNIPEWLAISLVMVPRGTPWRKAALRSIFSSLPQPLMAIPAFLFVNAFQPFLPIWLWFAAWAMIWMAISELLPDALDDVPKETVATIITIAITVMIVFQSLIG